MHQMICMADDGVLLFGPVGTNFNETLTRMNTFSFKTINFKM